MFTLKSITSIEGFASGTAFLVPGRVPSQNGTSAVLSLDEAFEAERRRLEDLCRAGGPAGAGDIFAAHLEILEDPMLRETLDAAVAEGKTPVEAVEVASERLAALFSGIDDEYLRARADDVKDVCRALRDCLSGYVENPFAGLPGDAVIVSEELFPSDVAAMDLNRVRAFILRKGSLTSHVAIIARSKGIPVLFGVDINSIGDGDRLLVDGYEGILTVRPDEAEEEAFSERAAHQTPAAEEPLLKQDGTPVRIYGNAGSLDDIRATLNAGAEGIGLFRTEFLFMNSDHHPTEEEQFAVYRQAALECGNRPLTIRTLDIGGDKTLTYWELPREENPFLGIRGVRLSLDYPGTLKTQVRAILRAGAFGIVWMMLPMITTCAELRRVKEIVREAESELAAESVPHASGLPVGIMIETPAAVLTAGELARESAFFSIGTNDLIQYVMAADRGNPGVARLYDPMAQAVRKAIEITVAAAGEAGIPVGVCGEMASDTESRKWLASCGVDNISLSSPSLIGSVRGETR
ncbi:MAG: phosphoenolpyruvate--protein phosphotransferase [Bacteroidales bacterium]|nr:phosphoenolpyruvate--protein phosphotransferase [Bacteroidales bacterium]